jgi:thiamine biosynthesis lipoprotein
MSRFRPASELTALNRAVGNAVRVSPRLYRAIAAARRAWRLTDGSFDPRVLSDLERLGYRGAALHDPGVTGSAGGVHWDPGPLRHRRSALADVPWADLAPRPRVVRLHAPLDLGGIGKGLALRWAFHAAVHAAPAIEGLLLDAGGDLVMGGYPAEGDRWIVHIDDPTRRGTPVATVALGGGAISTTGTTLNRWAAPDGSVVHHLIDPLTGASADGGLLTVTVAGPDPAWTEVWAKALFLAGASAAEREARRRGLAAWWVETDGTFRMTPLARLLTVEAARG